MVLYIHWSTLSYYSPDNILLKAYAFLQFSFVSFRISAPFYFSVCSTKNKTNCIIFFLILSHMKSTTHFFFYFFLRDYFTSLYCTFFFVCLFLLSTDNNFYTPPPALRFKKLRTHLVKCSMPAPTCMLNEACSDICV